MGWVRTRLTATTPVPILMYHVIAAPPAHAPFPGLYVTPALFDAQMRALRRDGYAAVTLDELERAWRRGGSLPRKPIVISFDNGYRSQYTEALPMLRRLGWAAVENLQLSGLPPRQGGLSHREVVSLVRAGWELDTQGYSHADLPLLSAAELRFQILTARTTIERLYGTHAYWFCYPSGRYDPTVVSEVKAAGYIGSTTVIPGWAAPGDDPYRLPRLRVLGGTTPAQLLSLIAGTRTTHIEPESY